MASVNVALFEDLDLLAADAAGALDRENQPVLFDRLDWLRLTQRHCPPPGRLLAARAANGVRSSWLWLAREGAGARSFGSWYSLHVDAVGSHDPEMLDPLVQPLRRLARIELYPLERPQALAAAFRRAGWMTRLEPQGTNWQALTAGKSFAEYWTERPSRLRNTAKRRAKAAGLNIAIHDRFDEQAWADYERVYQASWKGEEGSMPFLRALAEQEGAAGTLRLGLAYKDGAPVAAQLWLVENGRATIHKLAYDEGAKSLSPGTVLSAAMFERVIDGDHVDLIDYGVGDEPYKRDWMDQARPLWRLLAINPRHPKAWPMLAMAAARKLVAVARSR